MRAADAKKKAEAAERRLIALEGELDRIVKRMRRWRRRASLYRTLEAKDLAAREAHVLRVEAERGRTRRFLDLSPDKENS